MTSKHWPVKETARFAAGAVEAAKQGDMRICRRLTVRLLEEHMKYMVPFGDRWQRAQWTIVDLKGQGV
jgi:hypothetical protein